MDLKRPLISIVTASYNYARFITETIESVIAQTYTNWELIIVDDGSRDNSMEVIKSYCEKDSRIKLFTHENNENRGLPDTVKLGINKSSGEWIAFLESDDLFMPDCLEEKVKIINEHPETEFIFSDVDMFGEDKIIQEAYDAYYKKVKTVFKKNGKNPLLKKFAQKNWVHTFSVVMAKKELLTGLNFNPPLKKVLDYWIWSQLSVNDFYYIDKKLTRWRMHGSSYINNENEKETWQFKLGILNNLQKHAKGIDKLYITLQKLRRCGFSCKTGKNAHLRIFSYYIFGNDNSGKR